jgi:hypothetical protein
MRIDSSGNVGIGTTNPVVQFAVGGAGRRIEISGNDGVIRGYDRTASWANIDFEAAGYTFDVSATEAMRIDSSGNLLVGTTSSSGNGVIIAPEASGGNIAIRHNTGSARIIHYFLNSNGLVGNITISGSSTSFNTTSDYRLKENVVGLTGATDRLKQLNPSRFNFIADADTTVDGFLAHEVQSVVPEAITGTKDAVDADGNPVHQGIDQSKLVPLLTAALQEALTKIDALETRITTLEG